MLATVVTITAFHFLASMYTHWRNPTKLDREIVVQHHEKCVMLGLVALAILWRTT